MYWEKSAAYVEETGLLFPHPRIKFPGVLEHRWKDRESEKLRRRSSTRNLGIPRRAGCPAQCFASLIHRCRIPSYAEDLPPRLPHRSSRLVRQFLEEISHCHRYHHHPC